MRIVAGKEDIDTLLFLFAPAAKVDIALTNVLKVSVKVAFFSISLSAKIYAAENVLEIDISTGFDLFGVLRKKAEDTIIQKTANNPYFNVWKHTNGNLRLSVKGISFDSFAISNGEIDTELEVIPK